MASTSRDNSEAGSREDPLVEHAASLSTPNTDERVRIVRPQTWGQPAYIATSWLFRTLVILVCEAAWPGVVMAMLLSVTRQAVRGVWMVLRILAGRHREALRRATVKICARKVLAFVPLQLVEGSAGPSLDYGSSSQHIRVCASQRRVRTMNPYASRSSGVSGVRLVGVGSSDVGSSDVGSSDVGSSDVGSSDVGSNRVRSSDVGSSDVRSNNVRSNNVRPNSVRPNNVRPNNVRPNRETRPGRHFYVATILFCCMLAYALAEGRHDAAYLNDTLQWPMRLVLCGVMYLISGTLCYVFVTDVVEVSMRTIVAWRGHPSLSTTG